MVAVDLTVLVYDVTKQLPPSERFGLCTQMRRAAVSIPANVAEGQACGEDGRYIHHLRIAIGSLGELMTHVEITRRLELLAPAALTSLESLLTRVSQLLHGLLRSRRNKRIDPRGGAP